MPGGGCRASLALRLVFRLQLGFLLRLLGFGGGGDDLRLLGTCDITPLEPEEVGWLIDLTTDADEDAVKDAFIFVEGCCRLVIERVAELADPEEDER